MVDPVTAITAAAIAKIACEEFAKAASSEGAKQAVGGAIGLVKTLRDKLWAKFKGNAKAETALAAVESDKSEAALTKLEVYLDDAMTDDPAFATEVKQLAHQIINVQNTSGDRTYNQTAGRDIFNIDKVEGQSNRFGGGA